MSRVYIDETGRVHTLADEQAERDNDDRRKITERQAQQEREREEAEAKRRAAAVDTYGVVLDAWPTLGPQVARDAAEARAQFLDALKADTAFGAFLAWMQAEYRQAQARHIRGAALEQIEHRRSAATEGVKAIRFGEVIQQALRDAAGALGWDDPIDAARQHLAGDDAGHPLPTPQPGPEGTADFRPSNGTFPPEGAA